MAIVAANRACQDVVDYERDGNRCAMLTIKIPYTLALATAAR